MTLDLQNIIQLVTPQYLLIAILSPISIYMIINASFPSISIIPIILSFGFGVLAFNTTNMIFDSNIDAKTKPLRPIPSKRVSIREASILAVIFFSLSIALAFFVNQAFLLIMLIFTLFSYFYSSPILNFRKYIWGSSFTGTILYGILPFLAATTISANSPDPIFFVFFTLLITVISDTKDFEDLVSERELGISSLPIAMGEETAAKLMVFNEFLLLFVMMILSLFSYVPFKFFYASLISLVFLSAFASLFIRYITEIKYTNLLLEKFNSRISDKTKGEFRKTIFQSQAVTISVVFAVMTQFLFGVFAISVI